MYSSSTTITAFAGEQVAGSVMVFYDPTGQPDAERTGATEWVFVLPQWRRRGVARYLLWAGLVYLQERGLDHAELQVVSDNRQALALYEDVLIPSDVLIPEDVLIPSVGYRLHQEEVSLGLVLPWAGNGMVDAVRARHSSD